MAGTSADTVSASYSNYCAVRKAVGWRVLAFTLPPTTNGPAGYETDRQTVSAYIRTNYLRFSDGLVDVANNGVIGCPNCAQTNTYFSDGSHLTAAGHLIVAGLVTNAIARIQQ